MIAGVDSDEKGRKEMSREWLGKAMMTVARKVKKG